MTITAWLGADIFDGEVLHRGGALLVEDGVVAGIVALSDVPSAARRRAVDGGTLAPGFVDLQVNGGGGVVFNEETSVDAIRQITEAHARLGTLALLPTLITDTPERTRAAVDAVEAAISDGVPGVAGIHLEGPHLSLARKGAHDPALIRPMRDEDEAFLIDAARRLPNVMLTLAPEAASADRIARLARAGMIVSLGHSDCGFDAAMATIAAGARCVTHLFNAMSQLGNREPGLVGAALASGTVSAGLIADGIHVHPETIRAALAAKRGPGRIFLVTDAMAPAGSDITEFRLNGRRVLRRDGRLTLEDGTLAGADLDFARAVQVLVEDVGIDRSTALAMCTSIPASLLRNADGAGRLAPGLPFRAIHLAPSGKVIPVEQ